MDRFLTLPTELPLLALSRTAPGSRSRWSRAPTAGAIDIPALASEFDEMTGANIRNAVLAAAFLAAAEDAPITQGRLERAARGEYLAMGRVLGKRGR